MKKSLILSALFLFGTSFLSAQQPAPDAPTLIMSKGAGNPFFYRDSITQPYLGGYPSVNTSLTDQVRQANKEIASIQTKVDPATNLAGTLRDVYVIGHSLGGVRALGLAAQNSRVKGVITIGSPVKGFSPMNQGRETLINKVTGIGKDLAMGLSEVAKYQNGWTSWIPFPTGSAVGAGWDTLRASILKNENITVATEMLWGSLDATSNSKFLYGILAGKSWDLPGVVDMKPQSAYERANISQTDHWEKKEYLRVRTGSHQEWYCYANYNGPWGMFSGWSMGWRTVDDYEWRWVVTSQGDKVTKRMPDATYVMNVVGTKNDVFSIIDSDGKGTQKALVDTMTNELKSAADFYDSCSFAAGVTAAAFFVTEAGLWAAAAPSLGATIPFAIAAHASGVASLVVSATYADERNKCNSAKAWTSNVQGAIAYLTGSASSDTGILTSDQTRTDMGGISMITPPGSAYPIWALNVNLNHIEEMSAPQLWGTTPKDMPGPGIGTHSYSDHRLDDSGRMYKDGDLARYLKRAVNNDTTWAKMIVSDTFIPAARSF